MTLALGTLLVAALISCAQNPPSPTHTASVPLETTHWTLVRLGEKPVTVTAGAQPPSLTLVPDGKSAHGSTGCNRFMGGYRLDGNRLRFTGIAATRMFCADRRELEEQYIRVLDAAARWEIVDSHLELYDAAGARLALLVAGP